MGRIHERLQVIRLPVGIVRSIVQYAVVAPAPHTGELRDGHDLDRSDSGLCQMRQPLDCSAEGALRREAADMQLRNDRLLPGPAAPGESLPFIGGVIDDDRSTRRFPLLCRGGGIGHLGAVGKAEAIALSRLRGERDFEPAAVERLHLMRGPAENQIDAPLVGSPQTKPACVAVDEIRAPAVSEMCTRRTCRHRYIPRDERRGTGRGRGKFPRHPFGERNKCLPVALHQSCRARR